MNTCIITVIFTYVDPISVLTKKYDSQSKNGQIKKKNSVYNDIIKATAKLKLDLNIINETCLPSTTETRRIRINELAKLLSPVYVSTVLIIYIFNRLYKGAKNLKV